MDFDEDRDERDDDLPDDEEEVIDLNDMLRDLKRTVKEEIGTLKDEIDEIKDEMHKEFDYERPSPHRKPRAQRTRKYHDEGWDNWGENFGTTIENFVTSIADSIGDSIDRSIGSIFQHSPPKRRGRAERRARESYEISKDEIEDFYDKGSAIMAALSDQTRLRMLKELEKEPLRQSDLSDRTNTKGGNFKHHITILMEQGLVRQEGVRERYMLTFAGREALKLVEFLYIRGKRRLQVPVIIDDEEDAKSEEDINSEEAE
ncbi:MAG: ArsR family transcriptional regulator [Candidatus Heimdallarchaeota archaeon]|nr:ArsR family transcriptional regulator [Candidatus Heimdallarchaeota archaeon]